jgi:hypothetical protein
MACTQYFLQKQDYSFNINLVVLLAPDLQFLRGLFLVFIENLIAEVGWR